MEMMLPIDIKEARELLEQANNNDYNHSLRVRNFEEGFQILNEYLMENPFSPYEIYIENIKRTYTRKFLEILSSLPEIDFGMWVNYLFLFIKIPDDIDAILERNPELKLDLKSFFEIHGDQNADIDGILKISKNH